MAAHSSGGRSDDYPWDEDREVAYDEESYDGESSWYPAQDEERHGVLDGDADPGTLDADPADTGWWGSSADDDVPSYAARPAEWDSYDLEYLLAHLDSFDDPEPEPEAKAPSREGIDEADEGWERDRLDPGDVWFDATTLGGEGEPQRSVPPRKTLPDEHLIGPTPLHQAASTAANASELRRHLASGVNVDVSDDEGATPLHYCARDNANVEVLDALVRFGADMQVRNDYGETPLHYAASRNGNVAVLNLLIEAGARVDARNDFGDTPLHTGASTNPSLAVVAALVLRHGAEVHATNCLDETALHRAARRCDKVSMTEMLLDCGADLQATNGDGDTPLHYAAGFSTSPAMIECLVARGANIDAPNNAGRTPLYQAAMRNDHPAVLGALIYCGADTTACDAGGLTPLDALQCNDAATQSLEQDHGEWRTVFNRLWPTADAMRSDSRQADLWTDDDRPNRPARPPMRTGRLSPVAGRSRARRVAD